MVGLGGAAPQAHLWNLKKNTCQVTLLTLNQFREQGLGRQACCILLKITQVCYAHELVHDF